MIFISLGEKKLPNDSKHLSKNLDFFSANASLDFPDFLRRPAPGQGIGGHTPRSGGSMTTTKKGRRKAAKRPPGRWYVRLAVAGATAVMLATYEALCSQDASRGAVVVPTDLAGRQDHDPGTGQLLIADWLVEPVRVGNDTGAGAGPTAEMLLGRRYVVEGEDSTLVLPGEELPEELPEGDALLAWKGRARIALDRAAARRARDARSRCRRDAAAHTLQGPVAAPWVCIDDQGVENSRRRARLLDGQERDLPADVATPAKTRKSAGSDPAALMRSAESIAQTCTNAGLTEQAALYTEIALGYKSLVRIEANEAADEAEVERTIVDRKTGLPKQVHADPNVGLALGAAAHHRHALFLGLLGLLHRQPAGVSKDPRAAALAWLSAGGMERLRAQYQGPARRAAQAAELHAALKACREAKALVLKLEASKYAKFQDIRAARETLRIRDEELLDIRDKLDEQKVGALPCPTVASYELVLTKDQKDLVEETVRWLRIVAPEGEVTLSRAKYLARRGDATMVRRVAQTRALWHWAEWKYLRSCANMAPDGTRRDNTTFAPGLTSRRVETAAVKAERDVLAQALRSRLTVGPLTDRYLAETQVLCRVVADAQRVLDARRGVVAKRYDYRLATRRGRGVQTPAKPFKGPWDWTSVVWPLSTGCDVKPLTGLKAARRWFKLTAPTATRAQLLERNGYGLPATPEGSWSADLERRVMKARRVRAKRARRAKREAR